LSPSATNADDVIAAFHRSASNASATSWPCRWHDALVAVVMVNIADVGLNLSDLTNAINHHRRGQPTVDTGHRHTLFQKLSGYYEPRNTGLLYPPQPRNPWD